MKPISPQNSNICRNYDSFRLMGVGRGGGGVCLLLYTVINKLIVIMNKWKVQSPCVSTKYFRWFEQESLHLSIASSHWTKLHYFKCTKHGKNGFSCAFLAKRGDKFLGKKPCQEINHNFLLGHRIRKRFSPLIFPFFCSFCWTQLNNIEQTCFPFFFWCLIPNLSSKIINTSCL